MHEVVRSAGAVATGADTTGDRVAERRLASRLGAARTSRLVRLTLPLVVAGLLAVAALGAVIVLTAHADVSRDHQVRLAQVQAKLNAFQGIPWNLASAHAPAPAVVSDQLRFARTEIRRMVADLQRDAPVAQLTDVDVALERNFETGQRIYTMLRSGQIAQTGGAAEVQSRTHHAAMRALDGASKAYRSRASAALTDAIVGSAAVILVLLSAFAFFYRRAYRARRAAEDLAAALRRSDAHLEHAQRLAALGSWEWHAAEERLTWSAEQARLHGWTRPQPPADLGDVLDLIEPDDRAEVASALGAAFDDGSPLSVEYGVPGPKGTRIVHLEASARRDARGRLIGVIGTCQDVTERFRRIEAERASRAKNEFLSRMSHELRTPLNAILGFGQLLELSDLDDRQRGNAAQVRRAGKHLLRLVNEVLEIARIESGEQRLSLEPVRVDGVIGEVVDLVAPIADARGITVTTRPDDRGEDAWVRADVQRLKQVLLNLLSNAVKYNHERGRVEISVARPQPGRVTIAVRDEGPGIAGDKIGRLFSPFDRLGAEQTMTEGTGLGLALSRGYVEAMGGTIRVESAPSVGTTVMVELDVATPTMPAGAPVHDDDISALDARDGGVVLCIEDNPSNLELIEQIFHARPQLTVLTAVQGGLGVELAREHRPDLVLLDLNLPDVPGEQVLRRLRADPATADVPVVVISADATTGQAERLLAVGARAYITKPIDVGALLRLVDETLLEPTDPLLA